LDAPRALSTSFRVQVFSCFFMRLAAPCVMYVALNTVKLALPFRGVNSAIGCCFTVL